MCGVLGYSQSHSHRNLIIMDTADEAMSLLRVLRGLLIGLYKRTNINDVDLPRSPSGTVV